jgi:hypothetical protein
MGNFLNNLTIITSQEVYAPWSWFISKRDPSSCFCRTTQCFPISSCVGRLKIKDCLVRTHWGVGWPYDVWDNPNSSLKGSRKQTGYRPAFIIFMECILLSISTIYWTLFTVKHNNKYICLFTFLLYAQVVCVFFLQCVKQVYELIAS